MNNLYKTVKRGLSLNHLVKATGQGLETPEFRRRAIADNGDIFYARYVAEPPITFLWGAVFGKPYGLPLPSKRLFPDPYTAPTSRLETEKGKHSKLEGGFYHA